MNTRLSGGESQKDLRRLWLERSPLGIGEPEDLTGAVVLLCGEAGRFITGTDIKIDGESVISVYKSRWWDGEADFCLRGVYDVLRWR